MRKGEFTRSTHDLRNCSGKFSQTIIGAVVVHILYHSLFLFFGWLINLCHLQFHTWMSNLTVIIRNGRSNCSLHYSNRTLFVFLVSPERYKCPISNTHGSWIFIFLGLIDCVNNAKKQMANGKDNCDDRLLFILCTLWAVHETNNSTSKTINMLYGHRTLALTVLLAID